LGKGAVAETAGRLGLLNRPRRPSAIVTGLKFDPSRMHAPSPPALSIIIPVLNEGGILAAALQRLAALRERGVQVIVVDGGSTDATLAIARTASDETLVTKPGRATQMNAGSRVARGDILLFLHADTQLPQQTDLLLVRALEHSGKCWGRFDVRIAGRSLMLPVIAMMMNLRSRLTGIATGDQGLFVRRAEFDAVGGFPDQALMEDIELSRRLLRHGRPICLRQRVTTSGRRWDHAGVWRTVLLMWNLRLRYWLGESPERLARRYRPGGSSGSGQEAS